MEFSDIHITHSPLVPPPPSFEATAGAIVDFLGVVRRLEGETQIEAIVYEAYEEMALRQLKTVARETTEKFGLSSVVLYHRVGRVPVAEPSLFLRVCADHRREAFAGCQEIIERLKSEVPIWKHPLFLEATP